MIKMEISFEYLEVHSNSTQPGGNYRKGTKVQSWRAGGLLCCGSWVRRSAAGPGVSDVERFQKRGGVT